MFLTHKPKHNTTTTSRSSSNNRVQWESIPQCLDTRLVIEYSGNQTQMDATQRYPIVLQAGYIAKLDKHATKLPTLLNCAVLFFLQRLKPI